MLPAFDSSQDAFWVCLPDEGLGFVVVLGEIAVDGGLEVDDRAEHPTLEPSLGEGGEEVFDGVEPGAGSWREVEGPARMASEPSPDLRMLMGGVVIGDRVDGTVRSIALRKRMNSSCRCRCMQRPMTVPSRTFSAANSVVVPCRL